MMTAYAIVSSIVGGVLGGMLMRHLQKRWALEAKAEKLSLSQDIYVRRTMVLDGEPYSIYEPFKGKGKMIITGPHANIDIDGKRK